MIMEINRNEDRKPYFEQYREANKEKSQKWRDSHKEEKAIYDRLYVKEHKEKHEENGRRNRKTDKGKKMVKKGNAKRRKLGFIPLNQPFEGSNGHHINIEEVFYIPQEVHRSVVHNVFSGKGMEEINHLALLEVFGGEC